MNKKRLLVLACTTLAIGATAYGMDQKPEQKKFSIDFSNEELKELQLTSLLEHAQQLTTVKAHHIATALQLPTLTIAKVLISKLKPEELSLLFPRIIKKYLKKCQLTRESIKKLNLIIPFLLSQKININQCDENLHSALWHVVDYDIVSTTELLLANGADFNLVDRKNYTVVDQAAASLNEEYSTHALEVLLKAGAPVTRDHHCALNSATRGPLRLKAVELLCQYEPNKDNLNLPDDVDSQLTPIGFIADTRLNFNMHGSRIMLREYYLDAAFVLLQHVGPVSSPLCNSMDTGDDVWLTKSRCKEIARFNCLYQLTQIAKKLCALQKEEKATTDSAKIIEIQAQAEDLFAAAMALLSNNENLIIGVFRSGREWKSDCEAIGHIIDKTGNSEGQEIGRIIFSLFKNYKTKRMAEIDQITASA